jgi:hypothetical protein
MTKTTFSFGKIWEKVGGYDAGLFLPRSPQIGRRPPLGKSAVGPPT